MVSRHLSEPQGVALEGVEKSEADQRQRIVRTVAAWAMRQSADAAQSIHLRLLCKHTEHAGRPFTRHGSGERAGHWGSIVPASQQIVQVTTMIPKESHCGLVENGVACEDTLILCVMEGERRWKRLV